MPSISVSRESETRVKADITVNSEELKPAEEAALKKVGANAEIKGFRKGKAPAHLLKQKFAGDIRLETLYALIDNHIEEVETKAAERIYRVVRIEKVEEKGDKMSFTIQLDLFPYVKIGKLKVAQLTKHIPTIEESDIDQEIKDRLLRFATYEESDNTFAEKNDKVTVDFEIWIDDAPSGEVQQGFEVELGSGSLSRELEQQIIDKKGKVGEEFKLKKNLQAQEADKERSYEIIATLTKILKPRLPELTDALVSEKFAPSKTISEFRARVRTGLEKRFMVALIRSETDKALKTLQQNAEFFLSESYLQQKISDFFTERKIERESVSEKQIADLSKALSEMEKPNLLFTQLIRDAEKNYQKKHKSEDTYRDLFKKYVRAETESVESPTGKSEEFLNFLNAQIDQMSSAEDNSPWASIISSYLTVFNREFIFNYFEDEGIVKKGKKMGYAELGKQLSAENASEANEA